MLVSLAVGLWTDQLIRDLFARAEWLGWLAAGMAAIALLSLLVILVREFLAIARLAEVSEAASGQGQPRPWVVGVELLRCLVIAAVVAGLAAAAGIGGWTGGLLLGVTLWVGFPLVLWAGALVHEKAPWKLAAIHAGDWLAKLLAVGVIVCGWQ